MSPYETLYIYEIKGQVPNARELFSKGFIGCWYEGAYSFLFFSIPQAPAVRQAVNSIPGLVYCSETVLDYKNWETGREFAPFQVGKFFIYPYWVNEAPPPNLVPLELDPGVVFGSGCHPTTIKCLESLCSVYNQDTPQKVIDLGCGTGILSLAAARLGAQEVTAVDCNNLSVETARRNVALNNLNGVITVFEDDARQWLHDEADLVCANMDRGTLGALLARKEFYNKRWYILSGMVGTEVARIKEQVCIAGLTILRIDNEKFWFTITAKRP